METPATFRQVLKNTRFLLLWLAHLVSTFGDWLALIALFSLVAFRFRGTAYHVAGILIAFTIPWAFLAPIAGVFVDRWNVKRTMIASDLIRAALAGLLGFASGVYQIYFLVFALSAVSCFFVPAQNVAIPVLVRKEELLVANALNAQTIQFNRIISPAIAGVLVAWAGEKVCFYLDSLTFVFSASMLAMISMARTPTISGGGLRGVFVQFLEGFNFLAMHPALRFVTLAITAAVLAVGAVDALMAIYVRDILRSEAQIFGALLSLVAGGTILGALLIGKFGQRRSKVYLVVVGILGVGLGIFVLAAAGRALPALISCVWLGLCVSAVLIPSQTLMQEETPQTILGRVTGTSSALTTVSTLVSVALAGKIADWIGIRNLFNAVACFLILLVLLGYLYARVKGVAETRPRSVPT